MVAEDVMIGAISLYEKKINDPLAKVWLDALLPLVVLHSPLLRLRYRPALMRCCNRINTTMGRVYFKCPTEAPNKLAVELETKGIAPPVGSIYVVDCERTKDVEGHVKLFKNEQFIVAAMIRLPKTENNPYETVDVTLKQLWKLFV